MSKDVRLEIRAKNAALLRALESRFGHLRATKGPPGIIGKAAQLLGVPYSLLQGVIRFQISPYYSARIHDGTLKPWARHLADELGEDPMVFFPPHLYTGDHAQVVNIEVDAQSLISLSAPEALLLEAPAPDYDKSELPAAMQAALFTLSKREAECISLRYGLRGDGPHTGEETAEIMKVSRTRIYQIEAKAIRKLRHPSRSAALREFIDFQRHD